MEALCIQESLLYAPCHVRGWNGEETTGSSADASEQARKSRESKEVCVRVGGGGGV